MRKTITAACAGIVLILSMPAGADEHEEKSDTFIYGTYFYCDVNGEKAADAEVEKYFAPAYEKAMEKGLIKGWGYLKHHTGGKWRRVLYHTADSVTGLLASSDAVGDMLDESMSDSDTALGAACRMHEDYIWKSESGNIDTDRGKVGVSVYYKCDMSRQKRADEIVANNFAPIFDEHLGDGKLTSWGWSSHMVGGTWRRLMTMTAKDAATVMEQWGSIINSGADMAEAAEFTSICGTHQDYIWNIAMEGRM